MASFWHRFWHPNEWVPGEESEHYSAHGETEYSPESLLHALTDNPLDYTALRRAREEANGPKPEPTRLTRIFTVALAVFLGIGVASAAVQLRKPVTGENNPRNQLVSQVAAKRQEVDQLAAQNKTLEKKISALQSEVLGTNSAELVDLEMAVGLHEHKGPGVKLVLKDSEPARSSIPGQNSSTQVNRVQDTEVQLVVNQLWSSGAEAISVNGMRVTARTAIRTAGESILVDFRPLSPPYEIVAIGDKKVLYDQFLASQTASDLNKLSSTYGIGWNISQADDLVVRAGQAGALRQVKEG